MSSIQDTLQFILKSIMPDPDQVSVETSEDNGLTVLTVSAPAENLGQIIGKSGRIIKSIRTILGISHPNTRFTLQIKE